MDGQMDKGDGLPDSLVRSVMTMVEKQYLQHGTRDQVNITTVSAGASTRADSK